MTEEKSPHHVQSTVSLTEGTEGALSSDQQRFWLLDRLEAGRSADCLVFGVHLRGRLDVSAFKRALEELVSRHDVLRTSFHSGSPQPVREVQSAVQPKMREIVLTPRSDQQAAEAGLALAVEEYGRPFDLTTPPLARFTLMRSGDSMHSFVVAVHRIVFDRRSWRIFLQELLACYRAFAAGDNAQLPSSTRFTDFLHWQRHLLDSRVDSKGTLQDAQRSYWMRQLGGTATEAELPFDRPRPAAPTFRTMRERSRLSPTLTTAIKAFTDREGASSFLTLLAAWQALLYRYSGQPGLAVGCPVPYRIPPELENSLGPFENVLLVRSDLTEEPSFRDLLSRVQKTVSGALSNQDVPLGVLIETLKPPRSANRHPLYQVAFEYKAAVPEIEDLTGLQVEPFEPAESASDLDLVLSARQEGGALELELRYAAELFDRATAARILAHLQTLLAGVTADPDCPVTAIQLPTEEERRQILVDWNAPPKAPPAVACLHRLFEAQAARTPNKAAVSFDGAELTYHELNARANQLARTLRAEGVGPETLVGLSVDRSPEIVIGILGILKSGGAYVPLDPVYPAERLQFMIEDSGIRFIVKQAGIASKPTADFNGPKQITLDRDAPLTGDQGFGNLEDAEVAPENAAYIIYTSGSTGTPKGVIVTHANVTRLMTATEPWFGFNAADVWSLFHSFAFDFSVWEMWGALLYGGRIVVIPYLVSRSPQAFYDLLIREKVTVLNQTPSAFRQLMVVDEEQNKPMALSLRYIIFGGEALHPGMVEGWFLRHGDAKPVLVNMYGITETTVHVTYRPLRHADATQPRGSVIGQRIPDLTMYLLDKRMQPVPAGVAGEIFVGGAGVARGYLNRDTLTRERFLQNPFGPGRLYKTGDLARWLPDGDIEYLGRADFQVKIRGLRIELGEIETLLSARPGIRECVVVVREDTPGDKRLVAYLVADGDTAGLEGELRRYLQGKLPEYMIPSAFVQLEALPQTPSGKLDRRALPKPSRDRPDLEQSYAAPSGKLEQILAGVWGAVLNLSRVGVRDTFFDLGGNSLLILQVMERLKKEHGIEVPAVKLFQYPTVALFAAYLAEGGQGRAVPARRNQQTNTGSAARSSQGEGASRGRVAIVGMAGRFPGARDVETLWRNLCDGRESVTFFSDADLDPSIGADLRKNPSYVKARGILEDADMFDAAFFGINPREAEVMDPQQRVFLESASDVIENAGYSADSFPGRIGVYGGEYYNSYYPTLVAPRTDAIEAVGAFNVMLANDKDFLTTRVSHKLNLTGPSVSIHTACSSSLVAVIYAVRALLDGWCDMAIAGGVAVTAPIRSGYLYEEGAMLSADGHCRPFDARAQGTTFSDGVALVALKRLEDAVADGDQIHGVILGTGINNDGSGKVSFTAPSVEGQAGAVALAYADAGVEPESISYIEAHGTGTPLGDPIEIEALARVFRARKGQKPSCVIGSIKGNFGHLAAASGAAGLIKTALALRNHLIPPTAHFERPNPNIGLDQTPFYVNSRLVSWESGALPRRAGVSSFGVGGTNAHVVVEEPPPSDPSGPSRPRQLVLLSARSAAALDAATSNLSEHFRRNPDGSMADAAFTLQTGRRAFHYRRMAVCESPADAVEALGGLSPTRVFSRAALDRTPDVAFMFPGQGAQYPDMGVNLYKEEPVFRETVDQCSKMLVRHLGRDLREALYPSESSTETAAAVLRETFYTQPALFTIEYALARLWMSWGIRPSAMIGHSIGEYVAACLADVFSLEDALMLVAARGRLMRELPGGAMLSVRLPASELAARIASDCAIAAVNGPTLCVVAGPTDTVLALQRELEAAQIVCRPLQTSHAFHSPMMDPVIEPFAELVREVKLSPPRIPFVSTVTAEWITPELASDPMYWARHLRQTVRFADGVRALWQRAPILLEVGPRTTTATLARQQASNPQTQTAVSSLGDTADGKTEWTAMLQAVGQLWMAGVSLDWSSFYAREKRRRVPLPTYPFERKRYWLDPAALARPPAVAPLPFTLETQPVNLPVPQAVRPEVEHMVDQQPRKTRLIPQVKEVFEQTSGIELDGASESATFLDLGFDSLFLTQVALNLKKKFGVPITFRQLLGELATVGLLAEFLDRKMPPDPPPSRPTAEQAAIPPEGPSPIASSPAASFPVAPSPITVVPSLVTATDDIRKLLALQVQLMAQQLQLLGVDGRALLPNAGLPVPAATSPAPSSPPQLSTPPSSEGQDPVAPKKAFGAGARITTVRGDALTQSQLRGLEKLTARYTSKTTRSKEFTQANRRHLADPRVVSGFRPLLKEIVYPIVVDRAAGSRLWDIDGNEYVDFTCGFGSCFLGWSPPFVTKALRRQLDRGFPIGPQTPLAGEVAQLICELTGHERAALCNTGSEAVLGAVRLARTATGRNLIAIFSGAYHGILDEVIVRGTRKLRSIPAAAGIPPSAVDNVLVLDYGTPESLEILRKRADELAAILVEPVQSRNPGLQPKEFLHQLRRITEQHGAALIFDEVVTGFRIHPAGSQGYFGIKADLGTYGKVIGGGMPVGVIAGAARFMDGLDGGSWQFGDDSAPPAGVTYFAGTFVRHPLTLAAVKVVLEHLKAEGPELQRKLNARADAFAARLNRFFDDANVPIHLPNFGSVFHLEYTRDVPYGDLLYCWLREKGIHIWDARPCFLTTAHTDEDLDRIAQAFKDSVAEMQEAEFLPRPGKSATNVRIDAAHVPVPGAQSGHIPEGTRPPDSAVASDSLRFPLGESQREMWIGAQMRPEAAGPHHACTGLYLNGDLDVEVLRRSIQAVVRRHEGLQCTFSQDGNQAVVHPDFIPEVPVHDLSSLAEPAREARVNEIFHQEARRFLDLAKGPLVDFQILKLSSQRHVLVFTAQMIVCDGWSHYVVFEDMGAIYSALVNGKEPALKPAVPMREIANWQQANAGTDEARECEAFWFSQFQTVPPPINLPTARLRPRTMTFEGDRRELTLPKELYQEIKRLAKDQKNSYFAVLLAAFQAWLYRLSGVRDLVVGVPFAAQGPLGMDSLVGQCANILPLRVQLESAESFASVLKKTWSNVLDAQEHWDFTYGRLISRLDMPRDPSRIPLVSLLFNIDPPMAKVKFGNLTHQFVTGPRYYFQYDLGFNLVEDEGTVRIECDYNRNLFDGEVVQSWVAGYQALLEAVVKNPDRPVGRLPMLDETETKRFLEVDAAAMPVDDASSTIHALIEAQVQRQPDAIAATCEGVSFTYGELDQRSNRLSSYLQTLGVGKEAVVGVCVERSLGMIVAMLSILKAGWAYVLIDPDSPREHFEHPVSDTRMSFILADDRTFSRLPELSARVVRLDQQPAAGENDHGVARPASATPDHLACIVYKSAPDGKLKGVELTHRSIVTFLLSMRGQPGLGPRDAVLCLGPISSHAEALELWLPLIAGAHILIAPSSMILDSAALGRAIEEHGITFMQATPSAWRMLVASGWKGNQRLKALCRGESLQPDLAKRLAETCAEVWNIYGAVEVTFAAMAGRVSVGAPVTFGRPTGNTRVILVDERLEPVPVGVPGEVLISGPGLARGYRNIPSLTAKRFISRAEGGKDLGRYYRTGDIARYRASGDIEFVERCDRQVHIDSGLIVPSEIEKVFLQHPAVQDVVVSSRADTGNQLGLVAYIVADRKEAIRSGFGTEELVKALGRFVRSALPEYMLPARIAVLEAMPRRADGTVDRMALPAPGEGGLDFEDHVAPRNRAEEVLAGIWQSLLNLQKVGVTDNFFDLGGKSLLAVRLFVLIEQEFGRKLPLATLFRAPTIEQLARLLTESDRNESTWPSLVPIQTKGSKPPLFLVHGAGGNVLLYGALAKRLGPDYPLYGLQSRGLDGKSEPLQTVEEMADYYLREVRDIQPTGPYFLGGYCLGGTVAYEMAQRLVAMGEEVAGVVMFDTYNFRRALRSSFISFLLQKFKFHAGNIIKLRPGTMWRYFSEKRRTAADGGWAHIRTEMPGSTLQDGVARAESGIEASVQEINDHAGDIYDPKPYAGALTVFKPRVNYKFYPDPKMGWGDLALQGLDIVELPVNPHAMLMEPYVELLARELKDRIVPRNR